MKFSEFHSEKEFQKALAKRGWRHIMRVLLGVTEAVIEVAGSVDLSRFQHFKEVCKKRLLKQIGCVEYASHSEGLAPR
ncbi:hypothetical protein [Microbulbifer sp. MCCC 1A16149]|uniref:hypothetical protein n=1 Tax=Microbulbifer sp. MCCC 1A16149 TaxID=3411322 RepID=UPI003D13E589